MKTFRGLLIAAPISGMLWGVLIWAAASLSSCTPPVARDGATVRISGYLDQRTSDALARTLISGDVVVLDSDGGRVAPAARMAGLIRITGADTRVDGQCASACALLYAAGVHRSVDPGSRVGVHRSDAGPEVDDAMADMLGAFGAPDDVVAAMLATPQHSVTWVRGW